MTLTNVPSSLLITAEYLFLYIGRHHIMSIYAPSLNHEILHISIDICLHISAENVEMMTLSLCSIDYARVITSWPCITQSVRCAKLIVSYYTYKINTLPNKLTLDQTLDKTSVARL